MILHIASHDAYWIYMHYYTNELYASNICVFHKLVSFIRDIFVFVYFTMIQPELYT